jgi:hypothetical protein
MAAAQFKTIDIRELQEYLVKHMREDTPLAITLQDLTIGYYIPAHRSVSETDLQAFEDASQRLHALLEAQGIDPEDLINEYTTLRKARRKARGEAHRP